MLRLYKLYTHRILIYFIFVIRMFCDLIRTCCPSSLIRKIDWINLDRIRSKKEVSDRKHSIFSRIRMFWNNHDTTALHNSVRRDGVLFSLFSFFHNIEIIGGSLLEKNMDITKYFKKSNDKLGGGVLNSFVPWFSNSSVLSAAREINSVWEEQDRKKKKQVLPENVKKDVDYYSWKHGNPQARRWASRKYPDYTFKRETVRDWKVKCLKAFQSNEVGTFFTFPCQRTPSKMSTN